MSLTGFDERVHESKRSGAKFEVAAAKLSKSVLKHVSAKITIKGRKELRLAPDIGGVQLKKIIDIQLAGLVAEEEEIHTGLGGNGHDDDSDRKSHLTGLSAMRDSASKAKDKAGIEYKQSAEYKRKLTDIVDKVSYTARVSSSIGNSIMWCR